MLNVILWLVAIEAIGLVAFPLCYYLLPRLKDRGYSVSKALGLVVLGYLSWILSVLHILPSAQITVLALLFGLGGLSAWYFWDRREEFKEFFVEQRTAILVAEGIFLTMFFAWVVFRAYDPAIDHTEQPMDFAFLNASVRSFFGSPEDPWLRGESVSYYYFGYWMMGTLTKLTSIPSYVSYNLSLALIPALGAMGIFGLVYNMVSSETRRLRYALFGGVAASLLLILAANLEGVLEFLWANGIGSEGFWDWVAIEGLEGPTANQTETWRPVEWLWWWRATRVISTYDGGELADYTIHEFPSFSFILGDLHPHVMSIPFVLLYLAMCWNFLRTPAFAWREFNVRSYVTVFAMAFVLGALAFTNAWDLPVFWALLVGIAALKVYSLRGGQIWGLIKGSVPLGLAALAVVAVLYAPYFLNFRTNVSSIGAVGVYTTRPFHLFVVWVLLLIVVTPLVLSVFWRTTVKADWARLSLISVFVGFAPYLVWTFLHLEGGGVTANLWGRFFHVLPLALLVSIAVYTALWLSREAENSDAKVFAMLLAALGLLLIMGPELLFVDDSFTGALSRMNTVFKLYYQGWILLAAAAGFGLYYWRVLRDGASGWRLRAIRLSSAAFIVLVVGSAYYPLAAATTKGELFHGGRTLNGLDYVRQADSAEYKAIQVIRKTAGRDSAVLEAVGDDYSAFGRISASTGVPTVLGWAGHESQWRGSSEPYEGRDLDVATIYETEDVEEAKNLLAKYRVDYVYVGPRERGKYGSAGIAKFSTFMETLFSEGGVTVYRMRP